jgi:eukaryotic-like serine/threonine-protein kinase
MDAQRDRQGIPNLSGTIIANKYRVRRLIGTGGMGTVWEGFHEVLGTHVAIKFIRPSHAQNIEARARFEIEARAAAMITSKHAVQVFDYGVSDAGLPYIVMEYLEGEALSERLTRDGPMSALEAAQVIAQTARALTKAHAAGVVHRDLKPDNIFLAFNDDTQSGLPYTVKVVDFGIAKIFQSEAPIATGAGGASSNFGGPTAAGAVIGTPNFMSPEQLTIGGPPAPLSDVWSLGACAFTAFTARLPFEGDVLGDIVLKVCAAPLPVPSRFNPSVPAGFDAWFFRACSREPAKRFQTAYELAESLAAVCGSGPLRVATLDEDQVQYVLPKNQSYQDLADHIRVPNPMSPKTALLAGLVVGIAIMVGIVGAIAWRDEPAPSEPSLKKTAPATSIRDASAEHAPERKSRP